MSSFRKEPFGVRMNVSLLIAVACLGGNAVALSAQAGQSEANTKSEGARFEVASIKPCNNSSYGSSNSGPNRLRLECLTLDQLALMAFSTGSPGMLPHAAKALLKGGPSWTRSKRFTVDARTGKPTTGEEMRGPLMRELLRERFKLRTHEEFQTLAVYDLIPRQGGAKLQSAKEGGCFQMGPGKTPPQASGGKAPPPICGGFRREAPGVGAYGITMRLFCLQISQALERDVIDKTGLAGAYDLHLEMTYEEILPSLMRNRIAAPTLASEIPEAGEPGGTLFTALSTLGLQLKPSTAVARLVVIDHVEMPDEN
jgi:uncharacterized protein (TIGR03435 family)